jgi:hypothetical protein
MISLEELILAIEASRTRFKVLTPSSSYYDCTGSFSEDTIYFVDADTLLSILYKLKDQND